MKKGFISVLILTIGMICLAGCGKIKENKVRQFAETFAGYAAANSIDSVKAVYPTAKFGAVAPLSKDSIEISDKEKGKPVTVKYGADKWIEVEENEDGSFTVINSKGVASFPEADLKIAKGTGMMAQASSDNELVDMIMDTAFTDWLKDKAYEDFKSALTLTEGSSKLNSKVVYDYDFESYVTQLQSKVPVTITNNTNTPISGSDYNVSYTDQHWTCCDVEGWQYSKKTAAGKDVGPGESVTIELKTIFTEHGSVQTNSQPRVKSPTISWKISKDKVFENFQPKGTEYQEYKATKSN